MEYERIAKLLMLSTSDNDHEALSALRRANALLKKEKLSWQQVFEGASKGTESDPLEEGWGQQSNEMLQYCLNHCVGDIVEFIHSLAYRFYDQSRDLTPRQFAALKKVYNNTKRRR